MPDSFIHVDSPDVRRVLMRMVLGCFGVAVNGPKTLLVVAISNLSPTTVSGLINYRVNGFLRLLLMFRYNEWISWNDRTVRSNIIWL